LSEVRPFLAQIEDYPAFLEEAWQQHLAPRRPDAPTVVSLFAGCGGSSLGYSMAGFRELLAVEWDKNACETFRLNFPGVPVYEGDICQLSGAEALRLAGIGPGELDVLDGSPPCQGFSTAGKRDMADDRNQLFREFVRLLKAFQPRAFVMENVSGLVKGKMKLIFVDIMRELKAAGYQVSCRLLNAMWFGVPQSRQRLIFIGMREGKPEHPDAQWQPVTVRESIGDLPNDGPEATASLAEPLSRMRQGVNNGGGRFLGHTYGLLRLSFSEVSPTLIKETRRMAHPEGARFLSIKAAKRIASLVDGFRMVGSYGQQWERIGNSVPPLFMRAIAGHVAGLLAQTDQGQP
jgi:DNA (cytosine-5)-methyltransferase 1